MGVTVGSARLGVGDSKGADGINFKSVAPKFEIKDGSLLDSAAGVDFEDLIDFVAMLEGLDVAREDGIDVEVVAAVVAAAKTAASAAAIRPEEREGRVWPLPLECFAVSASSS